MRPCSRSLLAAIAATAIALAGASAAAANFVATATDPAGDSADPNPGRDITAIGMSYEPDSGELLGGIRLGGEPVDEADASISLFAGTQTATGCDGTPAAGFGSTLHDFGARWLRLDDTAGSGPRGDADKTGFGSQVQEFEITDAQLAGQPLNCVIATLNEPGNAANIYDVAGPLPLVGLPALRLKVGGVRREFRPGRPRKVTLTLANDGDGPTEPVRLKLSRARGMKVKLKTRSLKAIAPGRRAKVIATVTLKSRARDSTDLTVKAVAGDLVARQETTLRLRRPSKPGGGGGNGGGRPTQTCTRWLPDPFGGTGGSLILVPC
jgi:NPCBM-associated, NEW3 domain of alpha-galactosidase